MPKEYPPYVWVVARALFMEGKTPEEISAYFDNQPTAAAIENRAYNAKDGKTWVQEREENAQLSFMMLSPGELIKSAYLDMIKIMKNEEIDPVTKMDALAKATKFIDKFSDPRQKVTSILTVMQDFIRFLELDYKDTLLNDQFGPLFLEAVRSYKESRLRRIVGN